LGASELDDIDRELLEVAADYATRAWAPLSHYLVGAALLAEDPENPGEMRVHGGANVEDIILSLSCCAERVAIQSAIAEGVRKFSRVAVHTVSSPPAAPCGPCRQLLLSWGVEKVVMGNPQGEVVVATLAELLPMAFVLAVPDRS
jgi:cytidine deaminase